MFEGRIYKQTGHGSRSIRFADVDGGVATTTYNEKMSYEEREAMARRITAALNMVRDMTIEQIEAARATAEQNKLMVWSGSMPESNGKTNFTAILHRGDLSQGFTIDRSEYPDRVRYEADCVRWLIGETEKEPFILDYDADKHSGYVARATADNSRWQPIETAPKTGRTLLLGYPNSLGKWRTVRGQWMTQEYIDENWEEPDEAEAGWYETSVEAEDVPSCWPITPTHWQPLPTPPSDAAIESQRSGEGS